MVGSKAECEGLLNTLLPLAEQMLEQHGEFFPYGGAIKTNGEIISIAGYDGRERPPSSDIIALLKHGFVRGAESGEYKATALVYDVRIDLPSAEKKTDAIAVSLNHRDNYSVIVLFPYKIQHGKLIFSEIIAQEGEFDIFSVDNNIR